MTFSPTPAWSCMTHLQVFWRHDRNVQESHIHITKQSNAKFTEGCYIKLWNKLHSYHPSTNKQATPSTNKQPRLQTSNSVYKQATPSTNKQPRLQTINSFYIQATISTNKQLFRTTFVTPWTSVSNIRCINYVWTMHNISFIQRQIYPTTYQFLFH